MATIKYFLDTNDQVTIDGHVLSRLYLETKADFYHNYQHVDADINSFNLMKGGYVEKLENLSNGVSKTKMIAWVGENSYVYGDTVIPTGIHVLNSKLFNVTIKDLGIALSDYTGKTITDVIAKNSTIPSDCYRSTIEDSNVTQLVMDSTIKNSTLTKTRVLESIVENSTITNKSIGAVSHANLMNVEHTGNLTGTWSDVKNVEHKTLYYRVNRGHDYESSGNVQLYFNDDNLALFGSEMNHDTDEQYFDIGDTDKDFLLSLFKQPIETGFSGTKKTIEFIEAL